MINKLKRATRCMALGSLISITVTAALAQAPTEAQREAIKTDCRSDYIAHCSSVFRRAERRRCSVCRKICRACRARVRPRCARWKPRPQRLHLQSSLRRARPRRQSLQRLVLQQRSLRPQRLRRRSSPAAPRSQPYARPVSPTIQRSVPVCRPAALQHCSAWQRTRRRSRRAASRPSTPPPAGRRRRPRRRPLRQVLLLRPLRRRWCCVRCGRARNCSSCVRRVALTSRPFATALRPAVAASCNAWRCGARRSRPRAGVCWRSSPRSDRRSPAEIAAGCSLDHSRGETIMLRIILATTALLCASGFASAQELTATQRDACMGDFEKYCKGVTPGGGRIIACLQKESPKARRRPARRC